MNLLDKNEVVLRKVEEMKRSEFKATAIKVELEAQFDRPSSSNGCDYCNSNHQMTCTDCDGEWEEVTCEACDGDGHVDNPDYDGEPTIAQAIECENCEGSGNVTCTTCVEGEVDCEHCDGVDPADDWGRTSYCHDFILERLVPLGLAELVPEDGDRPPYSKKYRPIGALKFSKFYNDGSVDSEWTFTLSIEDASIVFNLPKMIEIFKELGQSINGTINVNRAGMHMALMNDVRCRYPIYNSDPDRFENFRKSMTLLLPALYFLGSGNEKSRELGFRRPRVAASFTETYDGHSKYSAIYYNGGAIEYRLFNTCYDNPEVILDNVVVMANTLRYWSSTYKPTGLNKITEECTFGNEKDDSLERFYCKMEHIDLLNKGLVRLKPSYYTIKQVKEQRKFFVNKRKISGQSKQWRKQAESEYKEYEERFNFSILARRYRLTAEFLERYQSDRELPDPAAVLPQIEERVETETRSYIERRKQDVAAFVAERLRNIEQDTQGQYTLVA